MFFNTPSIAPDITDICFIANQNSLFVGSVGCYLKGFIKYLFLSNMACH